MIDWVRQAVVKLVLTNGMLVILASSQRWIRGQLSINCPYSKDSEPLHYKCHKEDTHFYAGEAAAIWASV